MELHCIRFVELALAGGHDEVAGGRYGGARGEQMSCYEWLSVLCGPSSTEEVGDCCQEGKEREAEPKDNVTVSRIISLSLSLSPSLALSLSLLLLRPSPPNPYFPSHSITCAHTYRHRSTSALAL